MLRPDFLPPGYQMTEPGTSMCPLPHCPSCWLLWCMGGCSSRWPSLFITLPVLGGNIQANYFSSSQINLSDQMITNRWWPRGPSKMTYFSSKGKLGAGCRESSKELDSSSIMSRRGGKGGLGYSWDVGLSVWAIHFRASLSVGDRWTEQSDFEMGLSGIAWPRRPVSGWGTKRT